MSVHKKVWQRWLGDKHAFIKSVDTAYGLLVLFVRAPQCGFCKMPPHIYYLFTFAVCCSFLKSLSAFKFEDCGSAVGSFSNVTMSLCKNPESLPYCPFKRGSEGTLEIDFESFEFSPTMSAVVHGKIGGIKFPVNLPNKNGCYQSNVQCPLETFKTYNYKTTLPILKSYIKVGLEVQWELQDESSINLVCIKFPAKIVD